MAYSINATGNIRVYCKEIQGKNGKVRLFSTTLGTKKTGEDGKSQFVNAYLPVEFSKACLPDLHDGETVVVSFSEAWFKVYESKKNENLIKLFINRADIAKTEKPQVTAKPASKEVNADRDLDYMTRLVALKDQARDDYNKRSVGLSDEAKKDLSAEISAKLMCAINALPF